MTTFQPISDTVELQKIASDLRLDVLEMLHLAGSGHIGGPFGMADIFTALYFNFLRVNPENPSDPNRDYCLLSNGHICPIWYATLAKRGFFPRVELWKLRKIDSLLQGHPKLSIPGVENSSGPLGHGLSQAVGIALTIRGLPPAPSKGGGARKQKVICCMSDGEHQEGQTWEAVMSAAKWGLDNLIAIMDCNGLQIEGSTDEIMPLGNLADKYRAFGWAVREIDGHDFTQIFDALEWATSNFPYQEGNDADSIATPLAKAIPPSQGGDDSASNTGKPKMIIAHTILGKGVSFMENNWHYHDWPAKVGEYEKAKIELTR